MKLYLTRKTYGEERKKQGKETTTEQRDTLGKHTYIKG